MSIKVAVLDDHEFICRAISALGRDYPELAVVYTSTSPEEFQAWCLENHPDVAMVDLMLHGQLAGHETIRVLSQASISCLAFTADHRRVPISLAMRAGARGLALKDESPDKHFETLREIHETGWSPSSAMAAALIEDAAELPRENPGGSPGVCSFQGRAPPVGTPAGGCQLDSLVPLRSNQPSSQVCVAAAVVLPTGRPTAAYFSYASAR